MPQSLLALATAAVTLALAASAAAAPGDYVVADETAFSDSNGGVIRVNPTTGAQTELSSNQTPAPASGGIAPFNSGAFGIVAAANGDLLVTDSGAGSGGKGAVIKVDPATGAQVIVSDNVISTNAGQAGLFTGLVSRLALGPSGDIFVLEDGTDSIIRVNPATGRHTLVTTGDLLDGPEGIVVAANGDIFVGDYDAPSGADQSGALIKVNPTTGQQTAVSTNAISDALVLGSGQFEDPSGIALRPNGHVLVADSSSPPGAGDDSGAVIDVDPSNGRQTVVSSNGTAGGTALFDNPLAVRLAPNGDVLVLDGDVPGVIRVNPTNGAHELISGGSTPGSLFAHPLDLLVEPTPGGAGTNGGTAGGTQTAQAGGSLADTLRPFFIGGGLADPPAFAVNRAGRAETPVKSRARRGTTFRFTLSEPSRVVFTIERRTRGRRVGRRCRKQTRKNRKRRRCNRFARVGRFAAQGGLGVNGKRFSGRIGRRALRPGRYRASLVARDAAGNGSPVKRIGFRVVRR